MDYDEALARWGAARLDEWKTKQLEFYQRISRTPRGREEDAKRFATPTNPARVHVTFAHEEGYSCCGGRDPDCYCTYATPGVAELRVEERFEDPLGVDVRNQVAIEADEFDFAAVLRAVVLAGGGTITASKDPVPWRDALLDDAEDEVDDDDDEDDDRRLWSSPSPARRGRLGR